MNWDDEDLQNLRGFLGPDPGIAPPDDPDRRLGAIAVSEGFLTQSQIEECLRSQPPKSLLDAIVEKGLLSASQIQVLQKIASIDHPSASRKEELPGEPLGISKETPGGGRRIGRYRLLGTLGEGGMGIVFRAYDPELGREVALKVLKTALSFSGKQIERFEREERTAARLSHPGIATIFDLGRENDLMYYTMELIPGASFDVSQGSLEARIRILAKVARTVQFAHERGVIHRDLKPGNILVDPEGEPHLLDFGLSRDLDSPSELTHSGSPLGTVYYMSPEQAGGRQDAVDVRTDVYALGAILYEILSGRVPFEGSSVTDILQRIQTEEPPRAPGPVDLVTISEKALEKDKNKRTSSASCFAEDLEAYLKGEPIQARRDPGALRLWRKIVQHRKAMILTVVAIGLGLALGQALGGPPSPPTSVASVEELAGEVQVIAEGGTVPARKSQWLLANQGLKSGNPPSQAILRFRDGTELGVRADTILQGLSESDPSPVGTHAHRKAVFVAKGVLDARISSQPDNLDMILTTPHGQARTHGAKTRLVVETDQTWLEVTEGLVRVTRAGNPKSTSVWAGTCVLLGMGADMEAKPTWEGRIGYWSFDEGEGKTAWDASGHRNHGDLVNHPTWTAGKKGRALFFEKGAYMEVAGLSGPGFPRSGTLCFWIKADYSGQSHSLFDALNQDRKRILIRASDTAKGLQIAFRDRSDPDVASGYLGLQSNEWQHIAIAWDTRQGKTANAYLNGTLEWSHTLSSASWAPTEQCFQIGGCKTTSYFRGSMDEVMLFDHPLSPEEIRHIYLR